MWWRRKSCWWGSCWISVKWDDQCVTTLMPLWEPFKTQCRDHSTLMASSQPFLLTLFLPQPQPHRWCSDSWSVVQWELTSGMVWAAQSAGQTSPSVYRYPALIHQARITSSLFIIRITCWPPQVLWDFPRPSSCFFQSLVCQGGSALHVWKNAIDSAVEHTGISSNFSFNLHRKDHFIKHTDKLLK